MIPQLRPEHFAEPEYDPLFGDPQKPAPSPERAQIDDAYLFFNSAQGQVILNDLIQRYIARPIFQGGRDASIGYERNGEANVVRDIIDRTRQATAALQRQR